MMMILMMIVPMVVTLVGIVTAVSPEHAEKAPSPNDSGKVMVEKY